MYCINLQRTLTLQRHILEPPLFFALILYSSISSGVALLITRMHLSPSRVIVYFGLLDNSLVPLYLNEILEEIEKRMEGERKTNHSTSGVGVPITSASRRIVLPSCASLSFNFFKNSGGVAALGSLI